MSSLERIVSDGAPGSQTGMHDGGPAFQAVVMVTMKQVGQANGRRSSTGFNGREGRVIINNIVGEKNFIAAAPPEIQCGRVVQRARSSHPGKEQIILAIPEVMFCDGRLRRGSSLAGLLCF